ncbi:GNAT family N-acetyltransferase [Trinickia terrae]|uniref:GNAT family N-acetyltransferase n=1 Tax=Trinickia terrae TaxID=2571161 RepID=A0A4U1HKA0_9BURK|nr:GNAT family N-acetyltransferase [Trinickia terrae]TKC81655.1 GNAT family N-acetyltransferase [Trinickia terrae]
MKPAALTQDVLPALDTGRLLLRPRTMADLEACLAMDRDPEVTRHIAGPWGDPAAHRQFVEHRITRAYPRGLGYWSIFAASAPERFIGWVLLIPDHGAGPEVEIGWRLVREAWGRGMASEAARAIMLHAFETVRLPRIVADIAEENAVSRRVAEKLGMRRVGEADSDGKRYVRYRIVREDLRGG